MLSSSSYRNYIIVVLQQLPALFILHHNFELINDEGNKLQTVKAP